MLALAPGATADPVGGGAVLDAPTLALGDLGASSTINFENNRDVSTATFSFAVPQGLAPATLNATLEVPVELAYGNVSVTQGDRTICRMALPPTGQNQIVIPLPGVEAYDNWAQVTVTVTALPFRPYCWDPLTPLRLVNSSVTFTGREAPPTTVATFLPSTLHKLTIALPLKPSQAESEAAIQLAAAMAVRYGWQNTDIGVVPLAEGTFTLPDSQPGERQIILKEQPDKGVSLQPSNGVGPLLITGAGDELTNQTRLLTDASLKYALSRTAVAGSLSTVQKVVALPTTLEKLKQTGLNAEALRPEVSIKVDQSLFGQPLDGLRIHLIGSYTPLPSSLDGEVIARINDDVVDRWPVTAEGAIDRWVTVPNRLVQRVTVLTVGVHTDGDPGHCNDYLNPALRIDGKTEIQANRASPPVPPGLRSFPQALTPTVQIGIGEDKLRDTIRAAKIIVGLQRNSQLPLVTKLTSLKQAIDSGKSAVLISANGWTDEAFALPFSEKLGQITVAAVDDAGQSTTLTLDPSIKFGSVQTLFDGTRSLLIATSNGAPQQLDDLLRWLSEKTSRWSDLEGRAVISVPSSAPVTVPNRQTDLPADQETSSSDQGPLGGAAWWVAGGVAAAAFIGALVILSRTRKRRIPAAEETHTPGD